MALPADFSKIFGSTATGGLTPIGDVNYAKGWEFVGSNPPTKNDFSYLQNLSDLKSQWLYKNKLQRTNPFGDIKSDGAVKTALENLGLADESGYVGRLLNIQVFTSSGTVTKTPGAKKWRIKCLGAGGGSSAAPATGSNEVSVSNGGGSGAYAEGIYDVSSITTASVVIGSGGAGGTADSRYGADGGASSVGSFISSPGGKAGLPAGPATPPFQPVANTNSDSPNGWNIVGSSGSGAEPAVAVANVYAAGSRGSNSIFGVGGSIPAINNPANPGGGYGSGASGCSNGPSQSAKSGAAGRPGIVIIEELA